MMKTDKKMLGFGITMVLMLVAFLVLIILATVMVLSNIDSSGCLYRYNIDQDRIISNSEKLLNTSILNANGNYSAGYDVNNNTVLSLDPNEFGKWYNTNIQVVEGQELKLFIQGNISLCKAYVPINNVQSLLNTDDNGELIPIPRIEDHTTAPVTLYLDARTDEWRNITEIFPKDEVLVSLRSDQQTTLDHIIMPNSMSATGSISADCREGKKQYHPICGRYSIWNSSSTYVDKCNKESYECNHRCDSFSVFKKCIGNPRGKWDTCHRQVPVYGIAPEAYLNNGEYTSPRFEDINLLTTNIKPECSNNHLYVLGEYQHKKYFWFSADTATGLLYRFDNKVSPTNAKSLGAKYSFAKIQNDQSKIDNTEQSKIIMSQDKTPDFNFIKESNSIGSVDHNIIYLQYRLHDQNNNFNQNTGGYVLNIKHTKCKRSNGEAITDSVNSRGMVQYVALQYGQDPHNTTLPLNIKNISPNSNGKASITIPDIETIDTISPHPHLARTGYLWLKIYNDPEDYKDSIGEYRVEFTTNIQHKDFYTVVIDPLLNGFKSKVKEFGVTVFKNMTCYHGGESINHENNNNCHNFFKYIRALLTLYIIIFAASYLLGMTQITTQDLVIRVIKIGLVAGLMNDQTFDFFNSYIVDLATNFSDEILSNISGYSIIAGNISNPFMFLNEVMTKIFLSPTFSAQWLAMLSMGYNGILYFVIVTISLAIMAIVSFRAIAIYLMAFVGISVLIGLAPLFLTFILFERTRYLFDNWLKFMTRYMIEPVIMLAGIIILVQLFTIYLDYIVGYSVCWKCSLPFMVPSEIALSGISPAFLNVELFCLYWWAPWGFDHNSSQMGMNMQHIIILLIIAQCLWHYIDFSERIVSHLTGHVGGAPSLTSAGTKLSNDLSKKAQKKSGIAFVRDKGKAAFQAFESEGFDGVSKMIEQEQKNYNEEKAEYNKIQDEINKDK